MNYSEQCIPGSVRIWQIMETVRSFYAETSVSCKPQSPGESCGMTAQAAETLIPTLVLMSLTSLESSEDWEEEVWMAPDLTHWPGWLP